MILIYSEETTARLRYTATALLQDIGGYEIGFTEDISVFMASDRPRLNYSSGRITDNEVWIRPSGLLGETGVREQQVSVFEYGTSVAFFESAGDISFDLFSASFYLLSRYEEYLPHEKDSYGRYAHTNSLAYRSGFLDKPLVNIWLQELKRILRSKFPGIRQVPVSYRFMPTYDIDIAYAYLQRGLLRTVAGLARSILGLDFRGIRDRFRVLAGSGNDPYDVYEALDALHLRYALKPRYFFLVAARLRGYDRNLSPRLPAMQELIRYHAYGYPVGLHPSWQSGENDQLLAEEKNYLERITEKKVTMSRQHYIRLSLPESYRKLISLGIRDEYSMGYGSINGFRASVSSPFNWYDLEREEETALRIFPFCFMDANSYFEQRHTPGQAYDQLRGFHDIIRKNGGVLITIWHNSLLGSQSSTKEWRAMYELFLSEVVYWDL
jgi:hypothetical protein